jgi:hypothetical protein
MNWKCSMEVGDKKCTNNLMRKPEEKEPFGIL